MVQTYDAVVLTLKKCLEEISIIKNSKMNDRNGTIWQGRSESITSFFETEFANQLSKIYPKYTFLIDYPIALIKNGKKIRSQNIYPDITIIDMKRKAVKGIIELKADVGYVDIDGEKKASKKSNYKFKCLEDSDEIEFNKYVGRYYKDDNQKRIKIKIPKKVNKCFVILTEGNSHKKVDPIKNHMEKYGFNVISFLMTSHYNDDKFLENDETLFADLKKQKKNINKYLKF